MTSNYLDFETIKERWGKFNLNDGSVLKIKFNLTSVKTIMKDNKKNYNASIQNVQVVYPASRLMGESNSTIFTTKILQANIEKDDVGFEVLETPVNEYILDDNTKLKIFPQLLNVSRTSLKNKLGEPIYMVNTNVAINFNSPNLK